MLRFYILTTLRRLAKEKSYVFVNVFSLALGFASFLVLVLYLYGEVTFDKHHENYERIYRLITNNESSFTAEGDGPLLVQDFPQLGTYVRFRKADHKILSFEGSNFSWPDIYLADANVFDVFTHTILHGNPGTALTDRSSIAISESMAQSYFGESNPLGQILTSGGNDFRVTLVFEDLPGNTHLKYDALLPYDLRELLNPGYTESYIRDVAISRIRVFTYFHVPAEFDVNSFVDISNSFRDTYMSLPDLVRDLNIQRLDSIHFGPKLSQDLATGNIFYIYGFAAVAVFILAVASINYVNLATARAARRGMEVGLRKVMGANRTQLVIQFLGESLFFSTLAMVTAVLILEFALQFTSVGTIVRSHDLFTGLGSPSTALIGILFLGLFVSAVSGLYPAFYLSSISPKLAITNFGRLGKTRSSFRQFLIFVQLFISIGVIASTLLMTEQIQFVANKPLGFEKDNRVLIELQGLDVIENLETIRNELLDDSNVIDMAQINQIPGVENVSWIAPTENRDGLFESRELDRIEVGYNFIQVMGVELVAGRDFSEEIMTDRDSAIIVNEALVKELQWDDPIGRQIGYENFRKTVIGVTRDFHYGPLHNEIRPLHIVPVSDNFSNTSAIQRSLEVRSIVVQIAGDNTSAALRHIESTLRRFDPAHVFNPVFLSDSLDELYEPETNLLKLTGIFAAICIAISAMGLLGLAAFTTEQRFKEIGIRKTLGATSAQIVTLLTRNLLPLVALASIPSSFIAYIAIDIWLEKFAYQEDISLVPFIVSISVVAAVAFSTVALQSLKAAQSNPVETLKYE